MLDGNRFEGRASIRAGISTSCSCENESPASSNPPQLFGRTFSAIPAGNRYGRPDFYELHVWVWKGNPRGVFDDWNPTVSCE